jgi:hypothetical protein
MAVLKRPDPAQEVKLAKALGIDPKDVRAGSIGIEYTGGSQSAIVTWECIKAVDLDVVNKAMEEYYRA